MPATTPARRAQSVLSEMTLVPLGFAITVVVAFAAMAKWVGRIDAQQEADRDIRSALIQRLDALTAATVRAGEDAAATRAQVQMIVRELDRGGRGK